MNSTRRDVKQIVDQPSWPRALTDVEISAFAEERRSFPATSGSAAVSAGRYGAEIV